MIKLRSFSAVTSLALVSVLILYVTARCIDAAPASNNANQSGSRLIRPGLLSNLFRRQIRQQDEEAQSSTESSTEADTEEPQSQVELDAQKFVESLPVGVGIME